jgi:hypothetical protein
MRLRDTINGIEGVSSNATNGSNPTVNLPTERRHLFHRYITSGTKDNGAGVQVPAKATDIVDKVQYLIGSVTMLDWTADQIRKVYQANMRYGMGYELADNEIPIPFADPARATVTDENMGAWETYGYPSFTGKFTIKPGITGAGLRGKQTYDFSTSGYKLADGRREFHPIKRTTVTVNASGGQYDITTLPRDLPIQRIWLIGESAIDKVEVYNITGKLIENTREENAIDCRDYGIDPTTFGVTNSFPVLFDMDQQLSGGLIDLANFYIRVFGPSAQKITCLVEQRLRAAFV